MGRFYTSLHICQWTLEEKQVTTVGTIQGNRKGVGVIKEVDNRDVFWNEEDSHLTIITGKN